MVKWTLLINGLGVQIDGANVINQELIASNGVIHTINRVLLPKSQSIVDILVAKPNYSTLVTAVKAAGLADTLSTGI